MAARVLLVHPLGYSSQNADNDVSRLTNIMPPLGLASIAAYLEQHGIICDIIDCYALPNSEEMMLEYVKEKRPDLIGFSCTTATFLDGNRLAEKVNQADPQVKVVFGGVHVSALKEEVLQNYPFIDYCVVGEGEQALKELILSDDDHLCDIEGLVFRDGDGQIQFTGVRKDLLDLDSLPFPAYEKLTGYPAAYKLPIFNYPTVPNGSCISSRGCPYACSYCDRSVFRRTFRFNSADYLYDHVLYLNKKFGIKHINFYDDQFTFQRQRVVDFCKKLASSTLSISFNCAARAEHLDEELLRFMKDAGCWMISLGIETGDEELLAQHRQNPDLEMMREKIALIQAAGIRVKGLLMMGLPGETEQSIERSKKYVYSLGLDDFNLAKFTPFPGSPIYAQIKEKGELLGHFDEDWEQMDCMQFRFVPRGIEKERLEKLFIEFYKHHFQQSRVLWGYVTMLWKSPDSWKRFLVSFTSFIRFAFTNKRMKE